MFRYIAILANALLAYKVYQHDKKKLGNIISPTICFFIPTLVVAVLYDIVGPYLGFYGMSYVIYIELFFAALAFYIGGLFMSSKNDATKRSIDVNIRTFRLPNTFFLLSIFVLIYLLLRLYILGWSAVLADEDMQSEFASKGVSGHLLVVAITIVCYTLSSKMVENQRIKVYILTALLYIPIVFYQIKGWMIMPLLVSVFYKNMLGIKQNIIKYVLIGVGVILFFILGYAFTHDLHDEEEQLFILNHFLKYFFAGVGGWSEALTDHYLTGQNPMYLARPFSNIIGLPQNPVDVRYDFVLINENGEYTNVYTMIGNSLLFAGRFYAYLYFMLWGAISYRFAHSCTGSLTPGKLLSYSVLCTALALGFFGSYFNLLNIYEIMFYGSLYHLWCRKHKVFFY